MDRGLIGALSTSVFIVLLAGCGGSQPIGAPGAMPQTSAIAQHAVRGKSWMLPEASGDDLLYLTNEKNIYVYSYPGGMLVGTLTGHGQPVYECTDRQGDVFVATFFGSGQGVYEYAHGGSQPINYFAVGAAFGCALDPTTGNLAIIQEAGGKVYVYPKASGTPTIYSASDIFYSEGVTYDGSGNLYITVVYNDHGSGCIELSRGSSTFKQVTIQGSTGNGVGWQLGWDGKYLTFGGEKDARKRQKTTTVVSRVQMSGSTGTVVGEVPLARQKMPSHPQYVIHKGMAIDESDSQQSSYFAYFTYPGGKEKRKVKLRGISGFVGAALSLAPSRSQSHK